MRQWWVVLLLAAQLVGAAPAPDHGACGTHGRRLLQSPVLTNSSLADVVPPASGPTTVTLEVDTVQQDCLVFNNRYYDVVAIGNAAVLLPPSANPQPDVDSCCRSCHAAQTGPRETHCNVWQWCNAPAGCDIPGVEVGRFPFHGCQLLHIEGFSPYAQGNLTTVTGPNVPFTAGGAVDITVRSVEGYTVLAGADFDGRFDYNCEGTLEPGRCVFEEPIEAVAARCSAAAECTAFVYFPEGIDFVPPAVGILKGGGYPLTRADTTLNPAGAAYLKEANASAGGGSSSSSSSGGSSDQDSGSDAALIAGVAGGLGGLLLLVAGVLLFVFVWRPRRRQEAADKREEEAAGAAPGQLGGGASEPSSEPPGGPPGAGAALSGGGGSGESLGSKGGGAGRLLHRSNSPPSVVDAHMAGVLGQPGAAAAAPTFGAAAAAAAAGADKEQPPSSGSGLSTAGGGGGGAAEAASPFMLFDAATIAAMQAAAPSVVQRTPSWERLPSGSASASGSGRGRSLAGPRHPASGLPTSGTGSSPQPHPLHSGSGSSHHHHQAYPQYVPTHPSLGPGSPQPGAPWEGVVVAQVSPPRPGSALSSPPASLAAGSTARELLEAFARLYRQRPAVDYSALAGLVEDDEAEPGQGSASVSPQPTLEAAPGSSGSGGPDAEQQQQQGPVVPPEAAGAPPPPRQQQQQREGGQVTALALPASHVASGFFRQGSAASQQLPEMPWSDWALQPEEVEICRRQDGSWWQLGSGACGTVYKGLYHGVQPVAVKVLHQVEDGRRSDVFMREVLMLKSLRDRNIVQFLGASLDGANAMLVTEFMEFGDLWRALPLHNHSGERVFSWRRRGRCVALDVARGLHYLHHKRIVHLDLKSANILLSRHGTAKVADIGMARVLNRDYLSVLSGLGTFAWSAPEVLAGKRCTEKVDIYSLGIVIWEICTGEVPVRGDLRPLRVPEDCPAEVADLFARCTAEDPAARPTALEVVELLTALQQGEPPQKPAV